MAAPMKAPIPAATPLGNGATVEFRAINPTTGADVAGVKISQASIYMESASAAGDFAVGPFMYVPGPNA